MGAPPMRVLLLDNRDSFVWNLAQALQMLGAAGEVQRSDRCPFDDRPGADAVVLSPGPGRPEEAGICVAAVQRWGPTVPILGVCLGHQAIAVACGARVDRCPPCHGRATATHHGGAGVFSGLPAPLETARYHSLAVLPESLPPRLAATAHSEEGIIMAIEHTSWPATWGVQFHPESFLTPEGQRLLANFLERAAG